MSAAELARLRASYAHARERRSGVGEAYVRLRDALHDELRHELCMAAARAQVQETRARVARDCRTLRETLAFGSAP